MESILGEAVVLAQTGERRPASVWLCPWQSAGGLPCRISTHLPQASARFSKQSIVETTSSLQVRPHLSGLCRIYHQGQFQQKRRRFALFHTPPLPFP